MIFDLKGAPGRIRKYTGDEQKVRAGDEVGSLPPREMVIHNVLDVTDKRFYPLLTELFAVDVDTLCKVLAGREKRSSALFFRAERKLPPLTVYAADPIGEVVYQGTNAKPSGKPSLRISKSGDRIEMPMTVTIAVERAATLRIRDAAGADLVFNVAITQTEVDAHIAAAQANTSNDGAASAAEPTNKKGKNKDKVTVPLTGDPPKPDEA